VTLPEPRLLLISNRKIARAPLTGIVQAAFAGGCRWLMLREKDLGRAARIALARELMGLAQPYRATIIINGAAEEAREAGADGVHLPAARAGAGAVAAARAILGVGRTVGISIHSWEEARAAEQQAPDYLIFAPVFSSLSKPGHGPGKQATIRSPRPAPPPGHPLRGYRVGGGAGERAKTDSANPNNALAGVAELTKIARSVSIPVLALGGVTAANTAHCRAAGVAGIATIGTILLAPDPEAATRQLIAALRN
jgi:thiamine-phosphate pyrophosphorylase